MTQALVAKDKKQQSEKEMLVQEPQSQQARTLQLKTRAATRTSRSTLVGAGSAFESASALGPNSRRSLSRGVPSTSANDLHVATYIHPDSSCGN